MNWNDNSFPHAVFREDVVAPLNPKTAFEEDRLVREG